MTLAIGTLGWYGDVAVTQSVGMAMAPLAPEGQLIAACKIVVVVVSGGCEVVVVGGVVVEVVGAGGTVVVVVVVGCVVVVEDTVVVVVVEGTVTVVVVVVDVVVVVAVEHDGSAGDVAMAEVSMIGESTRRLKEATATDEHRRIHWRRRRFTRQTYFAFTSSWATRCCV
ncbi:MAG: hypothetical protein ABI298_08500, partial [Acidimicrobiales bacterium]